MQLFAAVGITALLSSSVLAVPQNQPSEERAKLPKRWWGGSHSGHRWGWGNYNGHNSGNHEWQHTSSSSVSSSLTTSTSTTSAVIIISTTHDSHPLSRSHTKKHKSHTPTATSTSSTVETTSSTIEPTSSSTSISKPTSSSISITESKSYNPTHKKNHKGNTTSTIPTITAPTTCPSTSVVTYTSTINVTSTTYIQTVSGNNATSNSGSITSTPSDLPTSTTTDTGTITTTAPPITTTTVPPAESTTTTSDHTPLSFPTSSLIATTTKSGSAVASGTPAPNAKLCDVHGFPVGDYYLGEFVQKNKTSGITLYSCYQFCASISGFNMGCESFAYYFVNTGAPRCDLYSGSVAQSIRRINPNAPRTWYDLGCVVVPDTTVDK